MTFAAALLLAQIQASPIKPPELPVGATWLDSERFVKPERPMSWKTFEGKPVVILVNPGFC